MSAPENDHVPALSRDELGEYPAFDITWYANPDSETNGETDFGTGKHVLAESSAGLCEGQWVAADASSTMRIDEVL